MMWRMRRQPSNGSRGEDNARSARLRQRAGVSSLVLPTSPGAAFASIPVARTCLRAPRRDHCAACALRDVTEESGGVRLSRREEVLAAKKASWSLPGSAQDGQDSRPVNPVCASAGASGPAALLLSCVLVRMLHHACTSFADERLMSGIAGNSNRDEAGGNAATHRPSISLAMDAGAGSTRGRRRRSQRFRLGCPPRLLGSADGEDSR